ncbi:MAG: hypothetical protein PVJ91_00110 [Flavobacteriaceae bacterium]|jgi:hypothetical protein
MKPKTFTIAENGLEKDQLKALLNSFIEENINAYKLQYLSNWSKNQDESPELKENKVKGLETLKEDLNTLFAQTNNANPVQVSIDIKVS